MVHPLSPMLCALVYNKGMMILKSSSVSSVSWSSRTFWLERGSSFTGHFPSECSYSNGLKEPHWPCRQQRCCSPAGHMHCSASHLVWLLKLLCNAIEMAHRDSFHSDHTAYRLISRKIILMHTGHLLTCLIP